MDLNVLHNISYGMFVVSSNKGNVLNGQIVNTVFQITGNPPTIAVSINKQNLTHEFIEASKQFSVSILSEDTPLNFIGGFGFKSGRKEDKFKNIKYKILDSGCPVVLDNTIAYLYAELINKFDCGTHTIFLGQVKASELLKEGKPMSYDFYHQVKHGTTPETAPTYIKEENPTKGGIVMQKYRCEVCNYIYDPAAGDPDGMVPPGTPFDKLPEKWVCPVCGADKTQFVPV